MTPRERLRTLRATVTEGRGTLTTTAMLHPLDAAVAGALLPRGLRLHPARGDSPARILVLTSRNHFASWFGEMAYLEVILAIADVTVNDEPPSVYFRRLYLNQRLPRVLGNVIYGWEKLPAAIAWDGLDTGAGLSGIGPATTFRVTADGGAPILKASFRDGHSSADVGPLWDVLAQPVLSQASRRLHADAATTRGGPFFRTAIRTEVTTTLRPMAGEVQLGAAFDPPALAGRTLDTERGVAFAMHTTQVIGLPQTIRGS